jgi:hypothetical protein
MMICSHCGRPWDENACRVPGTPVMVEDTLASKAPRTLLREEADNEDKGRNPDVLSR